MKIRKVDLEELGDHIQNGLYNDFFSYHYYKSCAKCFINIDPLINNDTYSVFQIHSKILQIVTRILNEYGWD